jgi:erythromycin esterase-like protein
VNKGALMDDIQQLRKLAIPLEDDAISYQDLYKSIDKARFILLGEASHGTAEFYQERIKITKKLIKEDGFDAVVIEGDWPDSYRVNEYINSRSSDASGEVALLGFQRFPTWMWRNEEVLGFVEWLKIYNSSKAKDQRGIGFYGMDLYSLFTSMDVVLNYFLKIDPVLAEQAKKRFSCFDHYNKDSQLYGYLASYNESPHGCEHAVVEQLKEMLKMKQYLKSMESNNPDHLFSALQNMRLIKNAENYYRTMFGGRVSSWNIRDEHMMETISEIDRFLSKELGRPAKIIVWAHNSHIGDARATQQGFSGEHTVGQLMRQKYPSEVFLLGFTTYSGYVTAASEWGAMTKRKSVNPSLEASYEGLFHQLRLSRFMYIIKNNMALQKVLPLRRLERAIGVVYLPQSERRSHYFYADLANQFDALIHIDTTNALAPLENIASLSENEAPETFPSGF